MAKMKCRYCGHEFISATKRPMCPQGCRLDKSELTRQDDYSTVQRVEGEYGETPTPSAKEKKSGRPKKKEKGPGAGIAAGTAQKPDNQSHETPMAAGMLEKSAPADEPAKKTLDNKPAF